MKKELIHHDGFVTTYLINDRFVVSHLYVCEKDGPRGDVKVFDTKPEQSTDDKTSL